MYMTASTGTELVETATPRPAIRAPSSSIEAEAAGCVRARL
jgi:hypothetical protein